MASRRLCVQTVVTDEGDARLLGLWARCLDRSLDEARRQGLIEQVVVTVGTMLAGEDGRGVEALQRVLPDGTAGEWQIRQLLLAPQSGTLAGHNHLASGAAADLLLITDVSACLGPSAVAALVKAISAGDAGLAEPRHIPCESLKPDSASTGEVSWVSSACCLIRPEVMEAIGGFDEEVFGRSGADIDFSWRARLAGFVARMVPQAVVHVPTTEPFGESGGRDRAEVKEDRLLLVRKYLSPPLAEAWARGWVERGTASEREAGLRFFRRSEEGRLPEPVAEPATDTLVAELFAFDASEKTSCGTSPVEDGALAAAFALERAEALTVERRPELFLSVIVRTQGRRPEQLESNLLSLVCQTCDDFEVLVVGHDLAPESREAISELVRRFPAGFSTRVRLVETSGGGRARPLNAGVAAARGLRVAFLDDDDLAFPIWVEAFRDVAWRNPDAVAWTRVAWQTAQSWRALEPPQLYMEEFDLFEHLRQNGTPINGLAVPLECFRTEGLAFREDLPVFEDWDMVLKVAQLRPFRSTGRLSALYRRGSPDNSGENHGPDEWEEAEARIAKELDEGGFVVLGEHVAQLRRNLDELDERRALSPAEGDLVWPVEEVEGAVLSLSDRRVLVISAHLDDAVLSCGDLIGNLPHCTVLTVFAGDEADWSELTVWDEASGFEQGTNVVKARIAEDDAALALLGASGVRLAFLDAQYRDPWIVPPAAVLGKELADVISSSGADVVLFPLGIGHEDHRLVAVAAASLARSESEIEWLTYQDLPYAKEMGGVEEASACLADLSPSAVQVAVASEAGLKAAALACYASQRPVLGETRLALALEGPERYWRLLPPAETNRLAP